MTQATSDTCAPPYLQLYLDTDRFVQDCTPIEGGTLGSNLIGKSFDQMMAKGDRRSYSEYISQLSTYDASAIDLFASLRNDDQKILARIRMKRESDEGWYVVVDPIEEGDPIWQLMDARQRLSALFTHASDGVAYLDSQARIVEHNQDFFDLFSFRSEHGVLLTETSIAGLPLSKVAPPEFEPLLDALQEPEPRRRRYQGVIKRLQRTLQVSLVPITLGRNSFGGSLITVQDLTPEIERDRLLAEANELARVIRESPEEVYILDRETLEFLEVNRGACDSSGYSREELLCMSVVDTNPCLDAAGFREKIEPISEGSQTFLEFQTECQRKDGNTYPVRISLHKTEYQLRPVYVAFVNDLTKMKLLETQLSNAQKLESIGQLAAGIAHEMNTPMQFLSGNIEFLENSSNRLFEVVDALANQLNSDCPVTWQERRSAIQKVSKECRFEYLREQIPLAISESMQGVDRTRRILEAMRDFSHPGSRERTLVDINAAIDNTLTISRNRWKDHADVELLVDEELPHVSAYAAELNQVLLNLIVNAGDAIFEKFGEQSRGKITIRTLVDGDALCIEVQDDGAGIAEEIQQRVFDQFFTTKEVGKGTGQGLSMAYNIIVNMHGGEIDLESYEGQGTTFRIKLPLKA